MKSYVQEGCLVTDFAFSASGKYKAIDADTQEEYMKYIDSLDLVPHPEAFGMHENAEITTNQTATRITLELVLSVQPRSSSGGGKSREEVIADITRGIQDKTPPQFDLDAVIEKYPTDYNESMNTVLA